EIEGEEVPVAGVQVFEADGEGDPASAAAEDAAGGGAAAADRTLGDVVGTITSSSPSPMRGLAPVALAVIKSRHAAEGARLAVVVDGTPRTAIVRDTVFFTGGAGVLAVATGDEAAGGGESAAKASPAPAEGSA
ncbi:MAG: glycine cleavage T C-terminal barrel domain-containing protein, partial [Planctomycetota bacterium]